MRLRIEICVGDHTNGKSSIVIITSLNFIRTPRQLMKSAVGRRLENHPTQNAGSVGSSCRVKQSVRSGPRKLDQDNIQNRRK